MKYLNNNNNNYSSSNSNHHQMMPVFLASSWGKEVVGPAQRDYAGNVGDSCQGQAVSLGSWDPVSGLRDTHSTSLGTE